VRLVDLDPQPSAGGLVPHQTTFALWGDWKLVEKVCRAWPVMGLFLAP
jgi:hypothetical protein